MIGNVTNIFLSGEKVLGIIIFPFLQKQGQRVNVDLSFITYYIRSRYRRRRILRRFLILSVLRLLF